MRIFFLGDIFHPNSQNWVAALRKCEGTEVLVWSLPPATSAWGKLIRWKERIIACFTLKQKLNVYKADLLIAYRSSGYGIVAALSGFHPFVVAAQGETDAWPLNHWTAFIKERVISYVIGKADLVHAWGQNMADEFIKLGVDEKKLLVLPRGIPDEYFLKDYTSRIGEEFRLVTTRSLLKEYGHRKILEGVSYAIKAGRRLQLSVVGKGKLMRKLLVLTDQLKIGSFVRFTGFLDKMDLVNQLKESNIYVSFPETDGVSASLLEAMATGNFPIVSRLKANELFIKDGVNGFLLEPGDTSGLSRCLEYLEKHKDFWAEAVRLNRRIVEQAGSDSINVPKFIEKYRTILKPRKG